jgi:hypothetical protein
MPKCWDQMTADEKLDELRRILDGFIEHYNNNVMRNNATLDALGDRLKKIEDAIGRK